MSEETGSAYCVVGINSDAERDDEDKVEVGELAAARRLGRSVIVTVPITSFRVSETRPLTWLEAQARALIAAQLR